MNDKVKKSLANIHNELTQIPQDVRDKFIKSLQRHSYSARLDAHHSVRSIASAGNSCSKTYLLVLSGRDKTNSSGKATLLIDSLLCGMHEGDVSVVMIREPHFVATPHDTTTPSLVTVLTNSTTQPLQTLGRITDRDGNLVDQQFLVNVTVEVSTWKHDGTTAENLGFSWICTIEAARIEFFG